MWIKYLTISIVAIPNILLIIWATRNNLKATKK